MEIITGDNPNVLHVRNPRRGQMASIVVFWLALALILIIGFGRLASDVSLAWAGAAILLAVASATEAAFSLLARPGFTLDKNTDTMTTWRDRAFMLRRRDWPLGDFAKVSVYWIGGTRTPRPFALYLEGIDERVLLGTESDYEQALLEARRVARFIDKPMVDIARIQLASGNRRRQWQYLREVVGKSDKVTEFPAPPPGLVTRYRVRDGSVILDFPMRGANPAGLLAMTVTTILILVVLTAAAKSGIDKEPPGMWIHLLLIVPLIWVGIAYAGAVRRIRVTLAQGGMEIYEFRVLSHRVRKLRPDEIDAIDLPVFSKTHDDNAFQEWPRYPVRPWHEASGIAIRCGDETWEIGRNLPEDELRWVHAVIGTLLRSEAKGAGRNREGKVD